jgi:peptidyl-tRNA hydrolase, PTH2 family
MASSGTNANFQANPQFMDLLMSMGISYNKATKALKFVNNSSVDAAAAYIFENAINSDSSDNNNDDDVPEIDTKMVFVVNSSLKMGTGKLAAQVAHAAVELSIEAQENQSNLFDSWYSYGSTKVVLIGQNENELEDLEKQAKEKGLVAALIRDAGRTEVEAGSMTVVGIFGEVSKVNEVTGKLKLLKD